MHPQFLGIPTYFISWAIAGIVAIALALHSAKSEGLGIAWAPILVMTLALAVGTKILYLFELAVSPGADPIPFAQTTFADLTFHGFRNPGGIVLLGAMIVPTCHLFRLPTAKFSDAVLPAVGVAVALLRLGCLLNGCCFSEPSPSPLALTFPPESRVYYWQVAHGLLTPDAARSLPVHPLQLYYATVAITASAVCRAFSDYSPGTGSLAFFLTILGGSFLVELLQAPVLLVNVIVTGAGASTVFVIIFLRGYSRRTTLAA